MTSTTQAVASPDTTGSIQQKTPVPMVLGSPPTTLKPPICKAGCCGASITAPR